MPVRKVSKTCYKYGTSGKKYCGSGAKKKATKQGQAIAISKSKRKK
jgi:hypothetical protein